MAHRRHVKSFLFSAPLFLAIFLNLSCKESGSSSTEAAKQVLTAGAVLSGRFDSYDLVMPVRLGAEISSYDYGVVYCYLVDRKPRCFRNFEWAKDSQGRGLKEIPLDPSLASQEAEEIRVLPGGISQFAYNNRTQTGVIHVNDLYYPSFLCLKNKAWKCYPYVLQAYELFEKFGARTIKTPFMFDLASDCGSHPTEVKPTDVEITVSLEGVRSPSLDEIFPEFFASTEYRFVEIPKTVWWPRGGHFTGSAWFEPGKTLLSDKLADAGFRNLLISVVTTDYNFPGGWSVFNFVRFCPTHQPVKPDRSAGDTQCLVRDKKLICDKIENIVNGKFGDSAKTVFDGGALSYFQQEDWQGFGESSRGLLTTETGEIYRVLANCRVPSCLEFETSEWPFSILKLGQFPALKDVVTEKFPPSSDHRVPDFVSFCGRDSESRARCFRVESRRFWDEERQGANARSFVSETQLPFASELVRFIPVSKEGFCAEFNDGKAACWKSSLGARKPSRYQEWSRCGEDLVENQRGPGPGWRFWMASVLPVFDNLPKMKQPQADFICSRAIFEPVIDLGGDYWVFDGADGIQCSKTGVVYPDRKLALNLGLGENTVVNVTIKTFDGGFIIGATRGDQVSISKFDASFRPVWQRVMSANEFLGPRTETSELVVAIHSIKESGPSTLTVTGIFARDMRDKATFNDVTLDARTGTVLAKKYNVRNQNCFY